MARTYAVHGPKVASLRWAGPPYDIPKVIRRPAANHGLRRPEPWPCGVLDPNRDRKASMQLRMRRRQKEGPFRYMGV